jgi:hypothetical protein
MGYLTTITIYNDHLGEFKEDPKQFGEDILGLIDEAFHAGRAVSKNDIIVQPSRHADDTVIYLHWGNTVTNISPTCKENEELITRMPNVYIKKVKAAEKLFKWAKMRINSLKHE